MPLYLIDRTDSTDYDEYIALVVLASSSEEAREIATETGTNGTPVYEGFRPDGSNLNVEQLVSRGESRVILASFNRG